MPHRRASPVAFHTMRRCAVATLINVGCAVGDVDAQRIAGAEAAPLAAADMANGVEA